MVERKIKNIPLVDFYFALPMESPVRGLIDTYVNTDPKDRAGLMKKIDVWHHETIKIQK